MDEDQDCYATSYSAHRAAPHQAIIQSKMSKGVWAAFVSKPMPWRNAWFLCSAFRGIASRCGSGVFSRQLVWRHRDEQSSLGRGLLGALSPVLTTFLDWSPNPGSHWRAVPKINTRGCGFHSLLLHAEPLEENRLTWVPCFTSPFMFCERIAGNLRKRVFTMKRWPWNGRSEH